MKNKSMTIDDLARMMSNSFKHVDEQFAGVNKRLDEHDRRFDRVDRDLKLIQKQLVDVVDRSEFEKLEARVRDLENMLAAAIKKAA